MHSWRYHVWILKNSPNLLPRAGYACLWCNRFITSLRKFFRKKKHKKIDEFLFRLTKNTYWSKFDVALLNKPAWFLIWFEWTEFIIYGTRVSHPVFINIWMEFSDNGQFEKLRRILVLSYRTYFGVYEITSFGIIKKKKKGIQVLSQFYQAFLSSEFYNWSLISASVLAEEKSKSALQSFVL